MKTTIAQNKCTGPRYDGEGLSLSALSDWHGKYGHANVRQLDHDSVITGLGTHDRVICCQPDKDGLYMRVDHLWELGMPTEKQMMAVARNDQGVKGRWKLARTVLWNEDKCTDCHFEPVLNKR